MASLDKREDGYRVRFGKRTRKKDSRKTIRLGHISKREAEAARLHIENLYQCQQLEAEPGGKARKWLEGLPAEVQNRIADKGLCAYKYDETHAIAGLCKNFVDWKRSGKRAESSIAAYQKSHRMLDAFFGAKRDVSSIAPAEVDDFVEWARTYGRQDQTGKYTLPLAATTLSRRLQDIKSLFRRAARLKWIPMMNFYEMFDSLPKQVRTNVKRRRYVESDVVKAVIEHAKSNEQRLIFALGRWGGIRVPSELLGLTWADVDRDSEKLRIRAPKQKHNDEEKHERLIPIWPEIKPYLDIAEKEFVERSYKRDPDGALDLTQPVIYRHRSKNTNAHRGLFLAACYRAGITKDRRESPWPKVWTNMRSTRVTELRAMYPKFPDAVNYWMNHSERISKMHYQQWESFEWRTAVTQDSSNAI